MGRELTRTKSYQKLITDLRRIIEVGKKEAQEAVKSFVVQTYWEMGQRITKEYPGKLEKPVFAEIARELDLERSVISRCVKLHRLWPQGVQSVRQAHAAQQLSWSHYELLMAIPDKRQRQFYLDQAAKHNWTRRALRMKIKDNYFVAEEVLKKSGIHKKGNKLERNPERLHLYTGHTKRVVDGDTLLVHIDLGFDVWTERRIRLRGIDCPELSTEEGKQAKRFVEQRLPQNRIVVIQTFQTDLHGRYVADVFYLERETDKEFIANKGNFLNQELISNGLAVIM